MCCDLCEAYTEAVREELPTARIVADHFHAARHYRDSADEVRKRELVTGSLQSTQGEYVPIQETRPSQTPRLDPTAQNCGLDGFDTFLNLLRDWWEEITN